jgi:hypothetical protein
VGVCDLGAGARAHRAMNVRCASVRECHPRARRIEQYLRVSLGQVAVVALGGVMLAASAFWTWLLLDLRRRRSSTDQLAMVVLLVGAVDYLAAGLAFVAGGALRNKWLVLLGGCFLIVRYFVFRWLRRWDDAEA